MRKLVLGMGCAAAVALAGCARVQTLPQQTTAQKTAIAMCATAGSAAQAINVAAPKLDAKAHALLKKMQPYCTSSSPDVAITKAQADAYEALIALAAPYLGSAK
jgi:hypothetical protein